jgi:hypothetical protein
MPDAATQADIERSFAEAVTRVGISGRVVIHGRTAELHGSGPVVSIELGELIDQWSVLPEDMRASKIDHAVERLRSAVARALPPPPETTDVSPLVGKVVGALLLVGTLAGAGLWLARSNFFGQKAAAVVTAKTAASASAAPADVLATKDRESCESARRRLYAGATALDVDPAGWVIEVWLARDGNPAPLHEDAALKDVTHERLSGRLGAIEPASASWVNTGEPTRARFRFEGGYLHPFMQAEGRDRFVALTDQLAEATGATHAALFARCAHSNVRDIGAYFRGRDPGGAAAALLFAQGLFSEPPIVDKAKLGGDASALVALSKSTEGMELSLLEELIRDNGGRVVTPETSGVRGVGLTFALGGPTRAQQAARALAKQRKVH